MGNFQSSLFRLHQSRIKGYTFSYFLLPRPRDSPHCSVLRMATAPAKVSTPATVPTPSEISNQDKSASSQPTKPDGGALATSTAQSGIPPLKPDTAAHNPPLATPQDSQDTPLESDQAKNKENKDESQAEKEDSEPAITTTQKDQPLLPPEDLLEHKIATLTKSKALIDLKEVRKRLEATPHPARISVLDSYKTKWDDMSTDQRLEKLQTIALPSNPKYNVADCYKRGQKIVHTIKDVKMCISLCKGLVLPKLSEKNKKLFVECKEAFEYGITVLGFQMSIDCRDLLSYGAYRNEAVEAEPDGTSTSGSDEEDLLEDDSGEETDAVS